MNKRFVATNGCVVEVMDDELTVYDKAGAYCYATSNIKEDCNWNTVNSKYWLTNTLHEYLDEEFSGDDDDLLDLIDGFKLAQEALIEWLVADTETTV